MKKRGERDVNKKGLGVLAAAFFSIALLVMMPLAKIVPTTKSAEAQPAPPPRAPPPDYSKKPPQCQCKVVVVVDVFVQEKKWADLRIANSDGQGYYYQEFYGDKANPRAAGDVRQRVQFQLDLCNLKEPLISSSVKLYTGETRGYHDGRVKDVHGWFDITSDKKNIAFTANAFASVQAGYDAKRGATTADVTIKVPHFFFVPANVDQSKEYAIDAHFKLIFDFSTKIQTLVDWWITGEHDSWPAHAVWVGGADTAAWHYYYDAFKNFQSFHKLAPPVDIGPGTQGGNRGSCGPLSTAGATWCKGSSLVSTQNTPECAGWWNHWKQIYDSDLLAPLTPPKQSGPSSNTPQQEPEKPDDQLSQKRTEAIKGKMAKTPPAAPPSSPSPPPQQPPTEGPPNVIIVPPDKGRGGSTDLGGSIDLGEKPSDPGTDVDIIDPTDPGPGTGIPGETTPPPPDPGDGNT